MTRVGEGPLPTELFCEIGKQIQKAGKEFGTTTGRMRRCGWFDMPLIRKTIYLNGYTNIIITKLDFLSNLETINICTGYELDEKIIEYPPELVQDLKLCIPIYKKLPGFDENISEVKDYESLPKSAKDFIEYLKNKMDVNIEYVSVGPKREQTFKNL